MRRPHDPARVLLVDALDAPGGFPADILARARALESTFGSVATCVVRTGAGPERAAMPATALRAATEALARVQPELVVIASTASGGGELARAVRGPSAWWWPTGVGGAGAGTRARRWPRWRTAGTGIAALPGVDPERAPSYFGASGLQPAGAEALDWAAHDALERSHSRLPLWDGRYLVAPVALGGAAGRALLEAFAALDSRWDRVDLVILADVQAEFQRQARALGIGARVHFAGAATADAELTWLGAAAGATLAPGGPIAASLVLRTLACNTPLVAFGALAAPVNGWLADRGALPGSWTSEALPGRTKLEHMLERDRAVEVACDRGREIAGHHAATALAARLKVALSTEARRRAA